MAVLGIDNSDYSEEDCAFALFRAKWPSGFRCPGCGHPKAYRIDTRRLPLYECANCRKQTSLIVGTVLEGSRTPLTSWFRAIRLHASPEGINALQLSTIIAVTYKTAWLMCHKIRHAMSRAEASLLLSGLVKVTTAIYCYQASTKHHFSWHDREQSVLVGVSEIHPGWYKRIKIKLQNKHAFHRKHDLPEAPQFIAQNVAARARSSVVIMSLQKRNGDYRVTRIANEAQRRLGELYRGIGPKHLQAYLDQYCYERNWRGSSMLSNLLRHCALTKTIIYRQLIARPSPVAATPTAPIAA